MRLSKHFTEHWSERIGGDPTIEDVQDIMRDGIIIQRFRTIAMQSGEVFRVLGIYWDPARNIVISVDELVGVAVSVFADSMRNTKLCLVRGN